MGKDDGYSGAKSTPKDKPQEQADIRKARGWAIIAGAVAFFSFVTGVLGYLFHPLFWGLLLMFLIGGGISLNGYLKSKTSDDNAFFLGWMVPALVGVTIVFAYICAWPKPPPPFEVRLQVPDGFHPEAVLTNRSLFFEGDGVESSNVLGCVAIPMSDNRSNVTFSFMVINTSSNDATGGVVMQVSTPKKPQWHFGPGWEKTPSPSEDRQQFGFQSVAQLIRGDGRGSPPIVFVQPSIGEGFILESDDIVMFEVKAANMRPVRLAFHAQFHTFSKVKSPKVIIAERIKTNKQIRMFLPSD
jgi:hypothetical protein